jgi:hypothetical protein
MTSVWSPSIEGFLMIGLFGSLLVVIYLWGTADH